ncbi:hypothetical protein [Clostridium botulinum]|uniref:Conserved domain protein n=1 Tax=Clostridium botulinum (strain Langeland / NCTC 10281 / Type F) TaxID=441772 RepID=A7GEF9_CLOBL|nr:hypothetical protein [Clostridium botulinum]ABS42020.1 conserved domain protein [Clostridium botulinum F str. Langeland]ADF99587.1 conserved domain protein [Clostridium botulinum F str. 230613]KKM42836.1 hypothetical protein VT72_04130 [Clostridium botulinum]MBY6791645.1 hypothetical protein [Clostridium botulinum]MBY6936881.1 hypothetical protein [Clostridium botulinum]
MLFKNFTDNELKEIKMACKELQQTVKRIRGEKGNKESKEKAIEKQKREDIDLKELLDEAQKIYNVNNIEFQYLLKMYIDNIEDNRKNICEKCDEVISECRKYR